MYSCLSIVMNNHVVHNDIIITMNNVQHSTSVVINPAIRKFPMTFLKTDRPLGYVDASVLILMENCACVRQD